MFSEVKKPLRSYFASALVALATVVSAAAFIPVSSAWAQSRALPDFTDLVEQVGPSVVNIRTSEKTKTAAAGGGIGCARQPSGF